MAHSFQSADCQGVYSFAVTKQRTLSASPPIFPRHALQSLLSPPTSLAGKQTHHSLSPHTHALFPSLSPSPGPSPLLSLSALCVHCSDITTLAKDHAYARLNLDEFTVGQVGTMKG